MTDMDMLLATVDDLNDEELSQLWQHLQIKRTGFNHALKTQSKREKRARVLGLHAHLGPAWMSDDFNDELSQDFWLGAENEVSP